MKKLLAAIAIIVLPFLCPKKVEAFQSLNINGVVYSFPDVDDEDWGQFVTDWAVAITTAIPSKKGGSFILTGELQFGATFGLQLPYIKFSTGPGAVVASTGAIRLVAGSSIAWRSQEGNKDLFLVLGASNTLWFNGAQLSTGSAASLSAVQAQVNFLLTALATTTTFGQNLSAATDTLKVAISTTGAYAKDMSASTTTLNTLILALQAGGARRDYDLYVGTPGTPNVDTIVGGSASFQAMFSSVGANGLTIFNSSRPANIFLNNGVYQLANTTIPAGVTITCASSVTFTPTSVADSMMSIYGALVNPRFDLQGRAYLARAIDMRSGGQLLNVQSATGALNVSLASLVNSWVRITDSSNVVVTGNFSEHWSCTQDNGCGGFFYIDRSSDVVINVSSQKTYSSAGTQSVFFVRSNRVKFTGNYTGAGGREFYLDGACRGVSIRDGKYQITNTWNNGFVVLRGLFHSANVKWNSIMNNEFIVDGVGSATALVGFQDNASQNFVEGNMAWCSESNTTCPTNFAAITDAGPTSNVFSDNHFMNGSSGTFLADSGTTSIYTAMSNNMGTTKP